MKILDIIESVEAPTPADINAKRIAKLKDELAHMPSNPQSQKEYDMIDDLKAEIKKLEGK